jgi:hypothetical protein
MEHQYMESKRWRFYTAFFDHHTNSRNSAAEPCNNYNHYDHRIVGIGDQLYREEQYIYQQPGD